MVPDLCVLKIRFGIDAGNGRVEETNPEIQMTTTATYGTLSASEHSTQLRKAVIASTIGTCDRVVRLLPLRRGGAGVYQ